HPAIIARCSKDVENARATGARVAVVDAALLLEVDMQMKFDFTIALTCDPEIRMARLRGRGGWPDEELRSRLSAEDGLEKHFYKADAVVDTGPALPDVLTAVDRLLDERLSRRSE